MKCIFHCDLDGRCAGAIVAYFTNNYNKEDYYEANYNDPLPIDSYEDKETVYLVDFSFTEETKHYLDTLIKKECKIIHIDHHTSTMELYENHPEYAKLEGIRSPEHSGAALTWMYFTDTKDIKDCPLFVQYVSDFDCWHWKMKETENFKFGMETVSNYGPLSMIWTKFIKEHYNKYTETIEDIIKKGKIAKKYSANINKEYCKNFAYVAEVEGNKCIVLNKKDGGSLVFGDLIKEYPMSMVWAFDGEYYQYSIYSQDPNIFCNKIAEKYGGGGHKGAAGFRLEDMPFKKI